MGSLCINFVSVFRELKLPYSLHVGVKEIPVIFH